MWLWSWYHDAVFILVWCLEYSAALAAVVSVRMWALMSFCSFAKSKLFSLGSVFFSTRRLASFNIPNTVSVSSWIKHLITNVSSLYNDSCAEFLLWCLRLLSRVSVSRAIRPFGNPGRPDDWFSQKVCFSIYLVSVSVELCSLFMNYVVCNHMLYWQMDSILKMIIFLSLCILWTLDTDRAS